MFGIGLADELIVTGSVFRVAQRAQFPVTGFQPVDDGLDQIFNTGYGSQILLTFSLSGNDMGFKIHIFIPAVSYPVHGFEIASHLPG